METFTQPAASNKRKLELEEQKKSSEFQNMGIHKWLLEPVKIPSDLADPRYALSLNDPALCLSTGAKKALDKMNIEKLFPVQSQVYKSLLEYLPADKRSWKQLFLQDRPGNHPGDILVSAPTGSGKTLAYVVPIVETLRFRSVKCLRALIILPTMDLVRQVKEVFDRLIEGTDLNVVAVSGGMNINDDDSQTISFESEQQRIVTKPLHHGIFDDFDRLFVQEMIEDFEQSCESCDILICTPGRLVDHLEKTHGFTLKHLKWLIIDEADKILASDYHDCIAKTLNSIMSTESNSFQSFRDLDLYPIDVQTELMQQFDDVFDATADLPNDEILISNLLGPVNHCRKILFSATLTRNPGKIASLHLVKPRLIATTNSNSNTKQDQEEDEENENEESSEMQRYILPASLRQYYWVCHDPSHKPLYLLKLLYDFKLNATLCFTQSIDNADKLYEIVSEFIKQHESADENEWKPVVAQYSSSLAAKHRSQILENFRQGKINILICTDALARGIDIKGLQEGDSSNRAIINYDTPCKVKNYVHRAGRTARAGKDGDLYNLLSSHECRHWKAMMRKYSLWEGIHSKKFSIDDEYDKMLKTYKTVLETVRQKTGRH